MKRIVSLWFPKLSTDRLARSGAKDWRARAAATVVWLDELRSSGALPQYQGMHVAALEKRILDADPDPDALDRRLAALGNSVPLHRIVYRYFPGPDDPPY